MRVVIREVQRSSLHEEFIATVAGFMDSLPAFQKFYPKLKRTCKYSLPKLYEKFTRGQFEARNALEYCRSLQQIIKRAKTPFLNTLSSFVFTTESCFVNVLFLDKKAYRLSTLCILRTAGLNRHLLDKMATSGLEYSHLSLAFNRGGHEGLRAMLTEMKEPDYRYARVTTDEGKLRLLIDHFRHGTERAVKDTINFLLDSLASDRSLIEGDDYDW